MVTGGQIPICMGVNLRFLDGALQGDLIYYYFLGKF